MFHVKKSEIFLVLYRKCNKRKAKKMMIDSTSNSAETVKTACASAQRPTAEGAGTAQSAAPRHVTRGEEKEEGRLPSKVLIDWLNVTFPHPYELSVMSFIECLAVFLGCYVSGRETGRGLHGFTDCIKLSAYVVGELVEIGNLAYGGEFQRGKWFLQLSGKGCGLVKDWRTFQTWLEELECTISRIDIAVDFMEGQYTVDDAVKMYESGQFQLNNVRPKSNTTGDWLEKKEGRTLYIGKRANGKMLRCYEKGKELGDLESNWVRFELQLGNRDRKIPFEVLTSPDKYFAGAYPALQNLLDFIEGEAIRTYQVEGKKTLANLLYHLKRCYGKALDIASKSEHFDCTSLVDEIRIVGMPRRIEPASVVAGLNWHSVSAELRRYEKCHL